jgi:N-hydroxyarylamine O-acetyltransferase
MPNDGIELAAYLQRVRYAGAVEPTLDVLAALHSAHVTAIPFENLDILLGRSISLDLGSLQAKLVSGRRGGYCFEQNTLFRAVLEAVGFQVTSLAARVRGGDVLRPRTHMILLVENLGSCRYLADVGFGGDGLVYPLALATGSESWMGGIGYRLHREDDLWVLEGNVEGAWNDLYAFTLEPQYPVDFEMANHFTSTYPHSPFVKSLTAQRSWPNRRAILRNRDLTVREGGATRTATIRDPDHLLETLALEFDLHFPAGTRFARPEF